MWSCGYLHNPLFSDIGASTTLDEGESDGTAKNSAIGGMGGSMRDSNSGTDDLHGDESRPTIVLKTEVFQAEADPILELLGRWEEYRRRGEEPPADWAGGIDAVMREELDRRIQRRQAA